MSHPKKDKGDLGVFKAQADLAEQGFMILAPLTEHAAFDIVIYRNKKFRRVQVKYRSVYKGAIQVALRSSWADKNGTHITQMDKNEVDLLCIYCPETDKCYYVETNDVQQSISLRVRTPKNNQAANIKIADDYRQVP